MDNQTKDFKDLKDIVSKLRGEDGCAWDKEQDFQTIKDYLLDETHEIIQAIENDDFENLKEELGDVLFQILFLAQMAEEEKHFNIYDSISHAYDKFVRRHPHVFDGVKVSGTDEIVKMWDNIKKKEKGAKSDPDILADVPKSLPALLRANEVSKRASKVGFDWENAGGIISKVFEELDELKAIFGTESSFVTGKNLKTVRHDVEEELGDILFSIVNLCRFFKISPENALNRTTNKFMRRFKHVQERAGYDCSSKNISALESYWKEAKELKL